MRALFLAELGPESAASRCRVFQYLPALAREGIEAEVVAGMPSWRTLASKAAAADVVVLQRRALPAARLALLHSRARRLVFDLDDAIWLRRRRGDGAVVPVRLPRRLRLDATVRIADGVVAGNDYLAAWARARNARAAISVLATPVDVDRFGDGGAGATDVPADGRLRLGWVGGGDNLVYLRRIEPALAALHARDPGVVLRVVSNRRFETSAIPVENVPWSLEREVENLRAAQIGLMPLDDDPWTRGKCAYKALQFMAAGVPVVCSPVGMARDVVADGRTGFLCADGAAWESALRSLASSPELRARVGAAGRAFAAREYALANLAPRLAAFLRRVARGELHAEPDNSAAR